MCTIAAEVVNAAAQVAVAVYSEKQKADAHAAQTEFSLKQAKIAENKAGFARQDGIENARQKKLQAILSMANDKSKLASNNISLSSATALNLYDDVKQNADLSALNILNSAERQSQSYLQTADNIYFKLSNTKKSNIFLNSLSSISKYSNSLFGEKNYNDDI